jgi:hypothetical protein
MIAAAQGGEMDQDNPRSPEDPFEALAKLFSAPRMRNQAHFRHRIGGPTEAEKALDTAFEEAFGPNRKHARWVRRLRRLGLIGD